VTAKKKPAKKPQKPISKPMQEQIDSLCRTIGQQIVQIAKLEATVSDMQERLRSVEARPGYIPPVHPTYPPWNPSPLLREVWCKVPREEPHCIYGTNTEAGR